MNTGRGVNFGVGEVCVPNNVTGGQCQAPIIGRLMTTLCPVAVQFFKKCVRINQNMLFPGKNSQNFSGEGVFLRPHNYSRLDFVSNFRAILPDPVVARR